MAAGIHDNAERIVALETELRSIRDGMDAIRADYNQKITTATDEIDKLRTDKKSLIIGIITLFGTGLLTALSYIWTLKTGQ